MRYPVVVLCLLTLSCAKTEAPVASDAEPEAADTSADVGATPKTAPEPEAVEPEPAPEVTLLSAGKPPLQELRRTFEEGSKEVLLLTVKESISMKGGGWDNLYTPRDVVQVVDVETKSVSDEGSAEVAFAVRKFSELKKSVKTPNAQQMNSTGVTGTYTIDSRGVITDLNLEPPSPEEQAKRPKKVAKPFLDAMRGQVRWMTVPFPEEPVGVGATWTVTTEVNELQTRVKETATVELVKLTKAGAVLKYEIDATGSLRHDFKEHPQQITYTIETEGVSTVASGEVVPRSAKLETKILQHADVIDVEGPEGELDVTTTRTIQIKSK